MKTIRYELADGIATITFDEPGSPVNTMCQDWQHDLTEVTARVAQDKDSLRGIILASDKSTFFAGADLKGTMRLTAADAPRVFQEIEQTKKNFRTLETLGFRREGYLRQRWLVAGERQDSVLMGLLAGDWQACR